MVFKTVYDPCRCCSILAPPKCGDGGGELRGVIVAVFIELI